MIQLEAPALPVAGQPGKQSLFLGLAKPGGFGGAHFFPLFGGVVFGAGEVVEAVGNVEGELAVGAAAGGAFGDGSVDVDEEVAAGFGGFAGNGVVAEADDVGGAVLAEVFAVGLGDAFVVDEDDGGEVDDLDLADGFHAELPEVDDFDGLDVFLGEQGSGAAEGAEVEAAVLLASIGDALRAVAFGEHDHGAALGLILALSIPLGDLAVSMVKRQVAQKDSGNFLPGHGGALDRLDTLLWAMPISYYVILYIFPIL